MKRIAGLLALCLIVTTPIWGAEPVKPAAESIKPVSVVLSEIRQAADVGEASQIDPSLVPDTMLEDLGESVMEERIGNHQLHEWMDNMMGGEGSASLAAMHRQMGYNYLLGGRGGMMPGMMGGMMGRGRWGGRGSRGPDSSYSWGPMMSGQWGHMWRTGSTWGWIIVILVAVLVLAGTTALIVLLTRSSRSSAISTSAPEILKARYARGEINKQEFEEKKKDLGI